MSEVTPMSLLYVVVVCTGATLLSVDHDRQLPEKTPEGNEGTGRLEERA